MKIKNYLLISILFMGFVANAQLYVSANTFMYVNDQEVFVKGNVELNAANSFVYLRKDGQLLQGTAAVGGANKGLGSLSVFQEGTVNNFQYNYWCSPVGGSLAAAGNSPFGITQLGVPTTTTATTPATILAMGNYNGVSGAGTLSIAPYWIWKYATSTLYSQWVQVASASTINAGEGFTMKGTSGSDATVPVAGIPSNNAGSKQRYDYRGKPNDGTINVPVAAGKQTLAGNPYPSAIDMQLFLTDATNTALCDGTALYWEHDKTVNTHFIASYKGGYGVYNGASNTYTNATFYAYDGAGTQLGVTGAGNAYQRHFAPIGQGFMIRGTAAGNVQLKNTHRIFRREGFATNSEFEKNANANANGYGFYEDILNVAGIDYTQISKAPTPNIRINVLLNNQGIRQVALVFMPNAIEGYDRADSKSADVDANLPYDMYLYLDNTEYVHSANKFDINNKYPVGFKNNTDATFKMQVGEFVNFTDASNVYLHDKVTDLYHDIKNVAYEISLPAGKNNSRYEITFKDGKTTTDESIADYFDIFQNNGSSFLTIKNPKGIALQSCTLYDVSGKTILSKTNLGANLSYEYSTDGLSEGVYIVKLITVTNQEITKKVSIFTKK